MHARRRQTSRNLQLLACRLGIVQLTASGPSLEQEASRLLHGACVHPNWCTTNMSDRHWPAHSQHRDPWPNGTLLEAACLSSATLQVLQCPLPDAGRLVGDEAGAGAHDGHVLVRHIGHDLTCEPACCCFATRVVIEWVQRAPFSRYIRCLIPETAMLCNRGFHAASAPASSTPTMPPPITSTLSAAISRLCSSCC